MADQGRSRTGGGWNYRVVERYQGTLAVFQIHEVYYDEDGQITAWSEAVTPYGEDARANLRADLHMMVGALKRETLQYVDLPGASDASGQTAPKTD